MLLLELGRIRGNGESKAERAGDSDAYFNFASNFLSYRNSHATFPMGFSRAKFPLEIRPLISGGAIGLGGEGGREGDGGLGFRGIDA